MTPPGEVISARYRVIRPLATGRMSRIWLAAADGLPGAPFVVVKQSTVPEGLTTEQREVVREWALRETRAAARVRHPNVIRTLEVLPDPDGPWTVMEYLPSRSLQDVVDESGPLRPDQVATIGLAVLAGLAAARRAGLLHLDLKPGNVLIADDGRVVLTDFGPAVTPAGVAALTRAGVVLGSPKYIAPERLFERASTEQTDLWSLGATLYHAIEGRPPYVRPTISGILHALADSPPDPFQQAGPLIPVLTGLLRRDPAERLTAAQVHALLRPIAEAGPRARSRRRAGLRPAVRRRLSATAAAAMLIAMLTAVTASAHGQPLSGTRDEAVPPAAASAVTPPLPAGFVWWQDPSGFRVALPGDWRRLPGPSTGAAFGSPRGGPTLRVSRRPAPSGDLVTALLAEEQKVLLEGYRRVRIEELPGNPPGAVWEYTFQAANREPMRGVRRVVGTGDQAYQLEWRTDRADWGAGLPLLTVVLATFTQPTA